MAATCLSHEIHLFATRRTSPMANSLRALTRHAAQHCGTAGAGVIGMCWTGGFALALAADKSVLGAVAAQPSLPLGTPLTPWCRRSLGMDESDLRMVQDRLATGEVEIYLTRFTDDWISPRERIAALKRPGDQRESRSISCPLHRTTRSALARRTTPCCRSLRSAIPTGPAETDWTGPIRRSSRSCAAGSRLRPCLSRRPGRVRAARCVE